MKYKMQCPVRCLCLPSTSSSHSIYGLCREIKIIGRVKSSRIWARISFMCSDISHTNVCDS